MSNQNCLLFNIILSMIQINMARKDREFAQQRGRVQQLQEVREGWTAPNYSNHA